jgi:AraC-like DNA-binding protein
MHYKTTIEYLLSYARERTWISTLLFFFVPELFAILITVGLVYWITFLYKNSAASSREIAVDKGSADQLGEEDELESQLYSTLVLEFRNPLVQIVERAQQIVARNAARGGGPEEGPPAGGKELELLNENAHLILEKVSQLLSQLDQKGSYPKATTPTTASQDRASIRPVSRSIPITAAITVQVPIVDAKQATLDGALLDRIHTVVEEHLSDSELTVGFLAKQIGLSKSQLGRRLSAAGSPSPLVLIRSVRIAKAKKLLQTSELTVTEIAYRVGFSDPNYFTRTFKNETDQCPTAYRQRVEGAGYS